MSRESRFTECLSPRSDNIDRFFTYVVLTTFCCCYNVLLLLQRFVVTTFWFCLSEAVDNLL